MNECYNIVVVCEGGECCCMNECYNIVVVVKMATAVVRTSATILLLL